MSHSADVSTDFTESEREAVHRVIRDRRDVRSHFASEPMPEETLMRILGAAHRAPSVGLMQPWEFIIIRSLEVRRRIHQLFINANAAAAEIYDGAQRSQYEALKLAAILDSALNICVTCDETSRRGHGLGRQTMPETSTFSAVCAVQNLWLAARAESIGVGWVSILDPNRLRAELRIPEHLAIVAYLCVGPVSEFPSQPELETSGWERRRPLSDAIHHDFYGKTDA
jgi:5,6-dimethylbenzimidazole synthase